MASAVTTQAAPSAVTASEKLILRVKKLSDSAIIPSRGSDGAAGYDLSAAHGGVVPARGKALVKTNLAIALPHGTYGRIGEVWYGCDAAQAVHFALLETSLKCNLPW